MIDFAKGKDGLVPAIAQDAETGAVLMLAWMNAEAFEETLRTAQGRLLQPIPGQTVAQGRRERQCPGSARGLR